MTRRRWRPKPRMVERPTLGQVQAAIALQAPPSQLTAEDCAELDQFAPSKPVQHEASEQAELTRRARSAWWAKGYRHHEQAKWSETEARRHWRQGVTPGWIDVTVHVPPVFVVGHERLPVLCAVELKRPSLRPRRKVADEWWLDWRPEWDALTTPPTAYGLSIHQARELRKLAACGYETLVAFSADEAMEWLEAMIGPRPAVEPDWGW